MAVRCPNYLTHPDVRAHTHSSHPRAALRRGPSEPPRGAFQLGSGSRTRQAHPKARPEPECEARTPGTQPPLWMGPADMPARGSNASPRDLPCDPRACAALPGLLCHPVCPVAVAAPGHGSAQGPAVHARGCGCSDNSAQSTSGGNE